MNKPVFAWRKLLCGGGEGVGLILRSNSMGKPWNLLRQPALRAHQSTPSVLLVCANNSDLCFGETKQLWQSQEDISACVKYIYLIFDAQFISFNVTKFAFVEPLLMTEHQGTENFTNKIISMYRQTDIQNMHRGPVWESVRLHAQKLLGKVMVLWDLCICKVQTAICCALNSGDPLTGNLGDQCSDT